MDPRGFPTSLPEFQRVFPDDAACADYEGLVELLVNSSTIASDIEARVKKQIEQRAAEKTDQKKATELLRREKEGLQKAIDALKLERQDQAKKVRAAVAKAFRDAQAHEARTLGEASLLQALLVQPKTALTREAQSAHVEARPANLIVSSTLQYSRDETYEVLRQLRLKETICRGLAGAMQLATRVRIPIIIEGVLSH